MTSSAPAPRTRVFLHVGSPKTGTTFLQNVLWAQRETARAQGLLLPLEKFSDHYLASLDVRGLSERPEHPARAVGIWDKVVVEAQAWEGNVLVSHELFASATAEQAADAIAALGSGVEVHVVLTVRDLVRQISAEWQEHVKHRSVKTFERFVQGLREDTDRTSWFWRVQDFADIARRWGATLPPERVHIVTVPPSGTSPEALWERYAALLGLDPHSFDTSGSRANTSLGIEQAELLRRVNAALGPRLPLPGPYPTVAKNVLAHRILASRPGTKLALDLDDADFAVAESRRIADELAESGYDVVGSLGELVPDLEAARAAASTSAYEPPSDAALLEESVEAIAALLVALADKRAERRQAELVQRMKDRPVRFALLAASERRPALMRLRRLYERFSPPEGSAR